MSSPKTAVDYEAKEIDWMLIGHHNLPNFDELRSDRAELVQQLFSLTSIRLDDCEIDEIDNLETFSLVTSLSLNHNYISEIQNLFCLPLLEQLYLVDNHLTAVSDLSALVHLKHLDLRDNAITEIVPDCFPSSLESLDLRGNPIAIDRDMMADALPNLILLDDQPLTRDAKPLYTPLEDTDNIDGIEIDAPALGTAQLTAEMRRLVEDYGRELATKGRDFSREVEEETAKLLADASSSFDSLVATMNTQLAESREMMLQTMQHQENISDVEEIDESQLAINVPELPDAPDALDAAEAATAEDDDSQTTTELTLDPPIDPKDEIE